jgi:hypothetical protein
MDIAQNSIRARASRVEIDVEERVSRDLFAVTVRDDGTGMDEETVARVADPFFTSRETRKVGLGVPLLKQNAEATGGRFTIRSTPGQGTEVRAEFSHAHLDRPPTGDIAETVVLLAVANPRVAVVYRHSTERGEYVFDSVEVREFLGDVPLDDPEMVTALREMIAENVKGL